MKNKNPFYEKGKAFKELGECLMNMDSGLDELAEKSVACGLHFSIAIYRNPNIKSIAVEMMNEVSEVWGRSHLSGRAKRLTKIVKKWDEIRND